MKKLIALLILALSCSAYGAKPVEQIADEALLSNAVYNLCAEIGCTNNITLPLTKGLKKELIKDALALVASRDDTKDADVVAWGLIALIQFDWVAKEYGEDVPYSETLGGDE